MTPFMELTEIEKCELNESINSSLCELLANLTADGAALSDTFILVITYLYSVIFLFGVLGNMLVIFSVLHFRKMQTATNIYLLNLAVADMLFLFALIFYIPSFVLQRWPFNNVSCVLFFGLTAINWYSSVFTLTAMSVDRYRAVVRMTASQQRLGSVQKTCGVIWVMAIAVMFPTVLYSVADQQETTATSCRIKLPDLGLDVSPDSIFIYYSFSIGFAIPMSLTSFFYVSVLVQLRRLSRRKTSSKRLRRSNRKVTVLVLGVILAYTTCWAPYWTFQLLLALGMDTSADSDIAGALMQFLTYVNAAINPVLYAFGSDNFRSSYRKYFNGGNGNGYRSRWTQSRI